MKKLGITHILNCTIESPNYFPKEMIYCNIKVKDHESTKLNNYFLKSNNFIDNCIKENGKVMVHCQMGISRSATLVIVYLMNSKKWSLQKSLKFVKDSRPVINPNRGFMRLLMDYDNKLFGKGSLGRVVE